VAVRSLGFLIGQSVKGAFLRVADTVGTSAHTTYGEGIKCGQRNIGRDTVCTVYCKKASLVAFAKASLSFLPQGHMRSPTNQKGKEP
jgi:hypothetical protein